MNPPPRFIVALGAIAGVLMALSSPVHAQITVTGTTSDNGYPAHLVQWTDAAGNPRLAMMVDQNSVSPGPYTGYLRQYTYSFVSGTGGPLQVRVCTGSQNKATGGDLEFSGDGFVQNHGVNGDDSSSGNIEGFAGTTTISGTSAGITHAVTITYSIPKYTVQDLNGDNQTVPTTVQWFFADGRNDPVFSVTQDATATPGSLGLDSRSPYGDMAYDGVLPASPPTTIVGTIVGGYSYGDQYKFVTLATKPEEVTPASPWQATEANTIPYAMQWTETATVNAEMGHVALLPLTVSDAGSDSQTSPYYDDGADYSAALYFDPRTQSYPSGPLPPWNTQAFQIINEPGGLSSDVGLKTPLAAMWETNDDAPNPPKNPKPTTSKRLAWQTNFGRLGGWNVYGEYTDSVFNYSTHSLDAAPASESYQGAPRASGALMSYSDYVVFGLHISGTANVIGSSYKTGAVGAVVTQMENAAKAALSGSIGAVVTDGAAGIPSSGPATAANENQTVTYSPAGYDPIYGAWNLIAAANAVNATLTPKTGAPLANPLFIVNGYTSSQLPAALSVTIGGAAAGYYATVDATNQRLLITVSGTASSATNLVAKVKNDFNGDGEPDLIWHNGATGGVLLWYLDGTKYLASRVIGANPDTDWQVVGTGNFNGDGNIDPVLQNNSTGQIVVWVMNGSTHVSTVNVGTVKDTDWKVAATGDFNGDGKPDLVFQNISTGQIMVWLMNGATHVSTSTVGTEADTDWQIEATGDFDGDGNTDLVWHNNSTGGIMFWFLNGTTYLSSKMIGAVTPTSWQIAGAGDFNGDGKPDLLWHNTSSGQAVVWFMNGTTHVSGALIGSIPDTDWQPRNR